MLPPRPCSIITRAACLIPRNTLRVRTANVRSKSSTLISVSGPKAPPTPALLKTTSSPPKSFTAVSISASTAASSATSVRRNVNRSGSPTSSTSCWPFSALRSPTTTRAPAWRNRSTVPRPMPLAPPVTTATRSDSTSCMPATLGSAAHDARTGGGARTSCRTTCDLNGVTRPRSGHTSRRCGLSGRRGGRCGRTTPGRRALGTAPVGTPDGRRGRGGRRGGRRPTGARQRRVGGRPWA